MVKPCELCELPARMFCESDQASLCWECDAKVHGANFLVARHSRSLLCRSCQAPTPWTASGSRLAPSVSVCSRCRLGDGNGVSSDRGAERGETTRDGRGGGGGGGAGRVRGWPMEGDAEESGDLGEEDDSEEYMDDDEEEDDAEEEGDNQVVPWSTEADSTATASCCSGSEDDSSSDLPAIYCGFLKRRLEDDDDMGSSSWHRSYPHSAAAAATTFPGQVVGEEEAEEAEARAAYLARSFRSLMDRRKAVRRLSDPAEGSTASRPRYW